MAIAMTGENPFEAPAAEPDGQGRIAALALSLAERRLGYGELYAGAFYLLGAKKELFLGTALGVVPILTLLEWMGTRQAALQVVAGIAQTLIGFALTLYLATAVNGVIHSRPASAATYLSESLSRFGSALFAGLIAGAHIVIGLILFVVPGLVLFVRRSFTVYAVVIDQQAGLDAVRRGDSVVRGSSWYVAGIMTINGVLAGVLTAGPLLLREVAAVPYVVILVCYAVSALVPFLTDTVFTLSYLNLRALQDRVQPLAPRQE